MDEYAASRSQLERLVDAAQSIKESLICRICLEYFKEPVTIKCGHKFCQNCILTVANSENATCPFCNLKIQKRSIPKNGNKLLQACVDQFHALVKAINSDSGIDVLEIHKNVMHKKESVLRDNPSTSKVEESSNASKESLSSTNKKSLKSKTNLQRNSKLSLQKKRVSSESKFSNDKKNTLDKYLSSTHESADNQVCSTDKVKSWLENRTPSGLLIKDPDNEDSSSIVKKLYKEDTIRKSEICQSEQNADSMTNAASSKDKLIESKVNAAELVNERNNDSPYKEVQMRVQEVEMIAKKKKANFSIPDRTVLRTPSSVPAVSHSDAYDWRRIRKVGKEMQIKTFKSLNVSVEKSSSSIALDDTVICNSTNNDNKNTSRESDTNNYSCNNTSSEVTQKKLFKDTRSTQQKENLQNMQNRNHKKHFINSSDSHHEQDIPCIDPKQVNEVIGIVSDTNVSTPEKTRNSLNAQNQENVSKLNRLSPLNVNLDNNQQNSDCDDKSSKLDSKSNTDNIQNSPLPKSKLSLKMKLTPSTIKPVQSQPSTPDKTHHFSNQSPKDISPERPRSRLSLRLPNTKTSECSSNKSKSPMKIARSPIKNNTFNKKSLSLSNRPVIVFKKLGKICKKRKNVPFLQLGTLKSEGKKIFFNLNKTNTSGIVIKSNVSVNVDYKSVVANTKSKQNSINLRNAKTEVKLLSPEKDSQLKLLAIESPHRKQYTNVNTNVNSNQDINVTNYESISMEFDEIPENEVSDLHTDIQQEKIQNKRKRNTTIELQSIQSKTSKNIVEKDTRKKINVMEDASSSKSSPNMIKMSDVLLINPSETSLNILSDDVENELEKSKNEEKISCSILKEHQTVNKEDDVISISSHESKCSRTYNPSSHKTVHGKNVHSKQKNRNEKCIVESSAESESSLTCKSDDNQHSPKKSAYNSTSTSCSSIITSPIKKKRTFSESSNDDDDVTSIIGKWVETVEKPSNKKPKISLPTKTQFSSNQNQNKSKRIDDSCSDDDADILVNVGCKQPDEMNKQESDSSIDNIISKVKHYRDNIIDSNKLTGVPSSLSVDMFESNEQPMQSNAKILPKQPNEMTSDHSSACAWSPVNKTNKENVNTSQDLSEVTMLDLMQFNKKKSISQNADGSDKENNECNQTNTNTVFTKTSNGNENHKNEIESSQTEKKRTTIEAKKNQSCSSQTNPYHDPDSLMNITQEQLAFKNIEKALGVNMSSIQHDKDEDTFQPNKFETPKKVKSSQKNNFDDFDSDNIDATPVVKRRHTYVNSRKSKGNHESEEEKYLQERVSPDKSFDLIPAITPMKNTKSYPSGHSTPMITSANVKGETATQTDIVLVCSSLDPEKMKTVHNFVNKFGARFENSFSTRVTHVIVSSDPSTKVCNKTFKYIQGIAFNKYVISFQWIIDCLKENRLLDEDDEKYEVLDPDIFEAGSTKSRARPQPLFEGFAIFCLEPFTSFSLKEFKDLLLYNGAMIVNSPQELSHQKDKFRLIIFESEQEVQNQLHTLKISRAALIFFDWVVDSVSQYQISSLFTYLCETTVEEALALGFPPEYLVEDTTIEEEEESES